MRNNQEKAAKLHENTPKGWYYKSIKVDLLQRYWHKRRFSEIRKLIEPVGGNILDIGCADGMFTKEVLDKSEAKEIIGVDVVKSSIDWAKAHWKNQKRMKFKVGDAEKLDFKSGTFDAVVALEVLEHVFDPRKVLDEIKRILKKGGYAIFLVPTDSLLFKIIWFFWLNFYPRGYVWRETHIQSYENDNLIKLCKKVGFKIEEDKKFNLGMLQAIKVRKV